MSSPKHTPAPWKVGGDGPALWVEGPDPDRNVICDIIGRQENGEYDAGLTDEDEANARLIAAAPRLAEALKELVRINEEHNDAISAIISKPLGWKDDYLNDARAALREAGIEDA